MANTYVYAQIAEAMIAAINSAWVGSGKPFASIDIQHDTEPKTIQPLPFVNLRPLEVKSDGKGPNAGVVTVDDTYRFDVTLYFPEPAATGTINANVPFLKMSYASMLRATLQTGDGFGGVANLPYVTGVDLKDRSPNPEGARSMRITFACHAQSAYFNS